MNSFKKAVVAVSLSLVSFASMADVDVERDIDVSRVSASYEQPFYLLKGAAKNHSDKVMQNVRVSFHVYQNGKVVDTITTTMNKVEPGETVRWQTVTTKPFNKFMVANAIAD